MEIYSYWGETKYYPKCYICRTAETGKSGFCKGVWKTYHYDCEFQQKKTRFDKYLHWSKGQRKYIFPELNKNPTTTTKKATSNSNFIILNYKYIVKRKWIEYWFEHVFRSILLHKRQNVIFYSLFVDCRVTRCKPIWSVLFWSVVAYCIPNTVGSHHLTPLSLDPFKTISLFLTLFVKSE